MIARWRYFVLIVAEKNISTPHFRSNFFFFFYSGVEADFIAGAIEIGKIALPSSIPPTHKMFYNIQSVGPVPIKQGTYVALIRRSMAMV